MKTLEKLDKYVKIITCICVLLATVALVFNSILDSNNFDLVNYVLMSFCIVMFVSFTIFLWKDIRHKDK
jgi:dolichyl-phosphate-mannose--protein O-mannosyl transferase